MSHNINYNIFLRLALVSANLPRGEVVCEKVNESVSERSTND